MRLEDFVKINPKVTLVKGESYPRIMMDMVEPGRRYVHSKEKQVYKSGGARFEFGDTLFARITPCLENGKIAQFLGTSGQVGFGSTEFFVFRRREGISNSGYVYYLSLTNIVRKPAEKSMFGASGRQRADLNVVKDIEIQVPPLPTQRKIAAILSAYDDLIENNTCRIQILEEMAQAIYREWFVRFRFPGYERVRMVDSGTEFGEVPEGWNVKKLGEVVELAYGKGLKKDVRAGGNIPVYGSSGIVGYHNEALVDGPGIIVGRKGNVGSVFWSDLGFHPIDTTYFVRTELSLHYVFYNLQNQHFINNDAAVPGLSRNQANLLPCVIPSDEALDQFEEISSLLFVHIRNLTKKNINLQTTRDLLLPKLVSGKVDVSKM